MEIPTNPFGDEAPTNPVKPTYFDPCEGYGPRKRFIRRSDGRPIPVDDFPEKEQTVTQGTALDRQAPAGVTALMPKDQLGLIKRTVAVGATDDELALYLYDCERRGIHPLDKLLHFTKRGGKYTPVTSIDFMRAQAAMSGEMAGSDDPVFSFDEGEGPSGKPDRATVTVYRMTNGQRFAYTATARWSEYCPDNAPMWRRMPHTMLGKCAEALALRKAFPQQLAGLYSREEMDQADGPTVVSAPVAAAAVAPVVRSIPSVLNGGGSGASHRTDSIVSDPFGDALRRSVAEPNALATGKTDGESAPPRPDDMPAGAVRVVSIGPPKAGSSGEITFDRNPGEADKRNLLTWKPNVVALAEQMLKDGEPCFVGLKKSPAGNWRIEDLTRIPKGYDPMDQRRDSDEAAF